MSDETGAHPPTATPPPIPQKKQGMSTGCIIVMVLGVLGIAFSALLVLAFVGNWASHNSRRLLSARAAVKSLELAIKGYQTEYNRLPSVQSPPPLTDNSPGYNTTEAEGRAIIDIITATDTSKNPRGISFYEPPIHKSMGGYTPERGLVDVWGTHGYIIIFDYNGDKKIADPEHPGATIEGSVIIYSAGPDGDFNTWKDNVKSWDKR